MNVSIAMATFNGARHLQAQLDSFASQTCLPDELVACDDGSSDATLATLEAFAQRAAFPVVVMRNQATLGYVRNFERALSACRGDIVLLSDQDDVWFPEKIARMVAALDARADLQVVVADMVLTDGELHPTSRTQLGNILDIGMPASSYVAGCATAMKRGWLDLVLPVPSHVVTHDNWIHRLAQALDVRQVLPAPLQFYRRHGGNASTSAASEPARVSGVRSALAHGLASASLGWQQEAERVRATRERIAASAGVLERLGLLPRQAAALARLDAQLLAIEARIRASRHGRLSRWPAILAMWVRGDYRHFAGARSALKDLVRP